MTSETFSELSLYIFQVDRSTEIRILFKDKFKAFKSQHWLHRTVESCFQCKHSHSLIFLHSTYRHSLSMFFILFVTQTIMQAWDPQGKRTHMQLENAYVMTLQMYILLALKPSVSPTLIMLTVSPQSWKNTFSLLAH